MKKYVEIVGGTPDYIITFEPIIAGSPFTFNTSGIKEFDVLEGVQYLITCTDSSTQECIDAIYCGTQYTTTTTTLPLPTTTTTTTSGLINVYWTVSSDNCNYGIFMIQLSGSNTIISTTSNTGGTFTLPINSFIYIYLNDGLCDQATLTVNSNIGYSSGGYVDYTINNAITDVYITGISYIGATTTTTTIQPISYSIYNSCVPINSITINNFSGGSGQYEISQDLFSTQSEALSYGGPWFLATNFTWFNNPTGILPNGIYWAVIRDKNNITSKLAKTTTLNCVPILPTTTTTTTPSYYAFDVCYSSVFLNNTCECINTKTVFSNVPVPGVGDYLYSDVSLTNEWSNNYVILFISPNLYPGWTVLTDVIDTGKISTIYYENCSILPTTTTTTTLISGTTTTTTTLTGGTTTTTTTVPCLVLVPEGFSPNGDGVHDYFQIVINTNCYPNATMKIFNRNGNLLFEKEHYGNLDYWSGSSLYAWWWGTTEFVSDQGSCTWTGLPGKIVKTGTYTWVLILGESICGCPNNTMTGAVGVMYFNCPPSQTTTTTTLPVPPLPCSGLSDPSECNISGCTIQSPCDTTKINGRSIFVSKDGTKMFLHVDVVGDANLTSRIFNYNLTTPYTPASAVYISEMGLNIPLPSLYSRHDIYFSDDGTTLLITILATNWATTANPLVETYILSTPWDITSSNIRYITQLYCNLTSNKYQQTISFNENNILATFKNVGGVTQKFTNYKNIDIKTIKDFVGITMDSNVSVSNSSYGNSYDGTRIGTNLDYFYFLLQNNSGNYNIYRQDLGSSNSTIGVINNFSVYKTKYPENFMYAADIHIIDSNGKAYILEDNRGKYNILFPRVGYYP